LSAVVRDAADVMLVSGSASEDRFSQAVERGLFSCAKTSGIATKAPANKSFQVVTLSPIEGMVSKSPKALYLGRRFRAGAERFWHRLPA
jgi:hypothetical protein